MKEHRANGNGNGNGRSPGPASRAWLWRRRRSNGDAVLPLDARLREIGDRLPPSQIDEIWIFPPLPDREFASEFIVLSCFEAPGRRRIVTAHVEAESEGSEEVPATWVQRLREHGVAPENWVPGIPDRLLERLSDAGVPRVFEIGGEPGRWTEALGELLGNGAANGAVNGLGNGNGNGAETAPGNVDSTASTKVTSRTPVESGATPET